MLPSEVSHALSICRFCQALSDAGHEVTLLAVKNENQDIDPIEYYGLSGGFDIKLISLNETLKSNSARRLMIKGAFMSFKFRHHIKNIAPDIIYSRLTLSELFFVPKDIPIIYEMHSLGFLGKHWIQRLVFKSIIAVKNFKRIVVTTDMLKKMITPHTKKLDIKVARLSAELPLDISKSELLQFKETTLKGRGNFSVGYTGYLDNYGLRGTDIILGMAKRLPEIDFHIVGGKPEMVEFWKKKCDTENVFFYGYMKPSLMPLFLSSFDVVVATLQKKTVSRAPQGENMSPLKLSQYLGYGCRIIASDLPAHREVLTDGETALLVPADDINEWCQAVEKIKKERLDTNKMSENAKNYYYSNLTPSIRVSKILSGI
jgi:glycosyltransferase involved in cell wall biosynthesis